MQEASLEVDNATGSKSFPRHFLDAGKQRLTGTLTVSASGGAVKCFVFQDGMVTDVDGGREQTFLAAALIGTGQVPPRLLRRAEKSAARDGALLGAVLMESNALPDDVVLEGIQAQVIEEVGEVFGWEEVEVAFTRHEPDERLEGFASELADYFELLADPEELFIEAALRLQRWDLVQASIDLLREVLYATPETIRYFREPETYPAEIRVLGAIDGTNDVEGVIRSSRLDPREAIRVVRQLMSRREVEPINPVQLYQLGVKDAASGDLEKAARRFLRARERGLNDFDIELRLAQSLEGLGRQEEAAAWYLTFADKCIAQLRHDEAVEALRGAVRMLPEDPQASNRLLQLLLELDRGDEAAAVALPVAERQAAGGDPRGALDLLLRVGEKSQEVKLKKKIVELAEAVKDHRLVQRQRAALAEALHSHRDVAKALEAYQAMFCEGDDSFEVRWKLVELHREQGNRQKAIDHLNGILALSGQARVRDKETLFAVHSAMVALRPGDLRSNRWLVAHHLEAGDAAGAAAVLRAWAGELEKEGQLEEEMRVLEQLIELEGSFEQRWALASALERIGREKESRRELLSLANLALGRKELDPAARALEHILRRAPLDLKARRLEVDLLEARGDRERAAAKLGELAQLEIIAGRLDEAEECWRRLRDWKPENAEAAAALGRRALERGERERGAEHLLGAARIHAAGRNLGLALQALACLLEVEPEHAAALALRQECTEAPRQAPVAVAAPQAPAPAEAPRPAEPAPFLPGPEPPKRTTVSGITARLKSLKGGKAVKPPVVEPPEPSEPPRSAPAAPDGAPAAPAGDSPVVATALKSAAARLKALAQAKPAAGGEKPLAVEPPAPPPEEPRGEPPQPVEVESDAPGTAPASARLKQPLGGPASRLAALRRGGK
jgi:tetratricopeptide (TPR) repeat protein